MGQPRTKDTAGEATAAIRAGDEAAFAVLAERHRAELRIHCYRMLGSLDDAEDALQDAFLRAWRYRESLADGAPLRPWLYRVATNACLDVIARDRRRAELARSAGEMSGTVQLGPADVTWLQPLPDHLLEAALPRESEPEARVLTLESIGLAFLTVIQLLTPQQRAALILRDVLDWSAKEAADLLGVSVAAANSALQRARATLRARLPPRKQDRPAGAEGSAAERELVRRYVDAAERQDLDAFESLIREDAIFRMPPLPLVTQGRDAILRLWAEGGFGSEGFGRVRCTTTRANGQPAVAYYVRRNDDDTYRALTLIALRIEDGGVAEMITFEPEVFDAFHLPRTLEPAIGSGASA